MGAPRAFVSWRVPTASTFNKPSDAVLAEAAAQVSLFSLGARATRHRSERDDGAAS